jgi:HD-GYP domain-containing protein (c-di-GMP phosphodiesterase class II)
MRNILVAKQVGQRTWLLAGTVLAILPAAFAYLRLHREQDITIGGGTSHFVIVSATALVALVLAGAVLLAARRLPDARTLFLASGFLAMAGIFLAHGAGTAPVFTQHPPPVAPRQIAASDYAAHAGGTQHHMGTPQRATLPLVRALTVGLSARLSLLVSAVCFALAVIALPARVADEMQRRSRLYMGLAATLITAYLVVALGFPRWLEAIAAQWQRFNLIVAVVTIAALAFAGWRFFQAYRLALLPLQGTMALGMALLIQAQVFMAVGEVWRLSWWLYHLAMLMGFVLPVFGLLWQYRVAGDLGAVVEGLFLRDRIRGLRAGDPRALTALAAAVAAKDSETGEHTERVGDLAVAIGRRVGVAEERLDLLRWAGRLHDLGKIGVPNRILRKPGRLTAAEFAVMQLHAPRGGQVALRSRVLAEAAAIIRAHHERLDGSGYPDGLRGDAIPLEARVIAVADVWDALTCDRPYRPALPYAEAAAIMRREAGPHLDSRCVDALFAVLAAAGQQAA